MRKGNKPPTLFLDSGAFSAYTKGAEIDLNAYISFIKKYEQCLDVYATLDIIGDAEQTYKNHLIMLEHGLNPIIAFHKKEDYKWLKMYVDKYDYIALGGIAGNVKNFDISKHLDKCFEIICNEEGYPKVKVHGFGVTSLKLLFRYPWYSVDSTSWVMTSRMGSVYVPRYRQGKWIYDEDSWKIAVSDKSPSQKERDQHFTTFSPKQREVILQYFKEKGYKLGKSDLRKVDDNYKLKEGERWFGKQDADAQRGIHGLKDGRVTFGWSKDKIVETIIEPGLSNDYKQRDELNIIYFLDLEKSMPKWPWAFKKKSSGGFAI